MKDKVKYILETPILEAKNILNENYDIIGLRFNDNSEEAKNEFQRLLPLIEKPLMIRGTGNDAVDSQLLPEILKFVDRECIIGIINENNYKEIVPHIINGAHTAIIRTPIDINLAKEMNILTSDMGLELDKIIIDTDIGGLGYGFEYGYSIMEKIIQEGTNDKYLNMPLISFAVEETSKTKEAKDSKLALYLEITSASAVKAAGADYVVMHSTEALNTLKEIA